MKRQDVIGKDVVINDSRSYFNDRIGTVSKVNAGNENKVLVRFRSANYLIKFSLDKITLLSDYCRGIG